MIGATLLMQEVARRGLMPAFLKFNPNHVPAGSPEGGQFSSGEGGGGADAEGGSISTSSLAIFEKYRDEQAWDQPISEYMQANGLTLADYKVANELLYQHNIASGEHSDKALLDLWHSEAPAGQAFRLIAQWQEWQATHALHPDTTVDLTVMRREAMAADARGEWDRWRGWHVGGELSPTVERFLTYWQEREVGRPLFFRKGELDKAAISTTTDERGARSSLFGGVTFVPTQFFTFAEMKAQGYRLVSGRRGLVGVTSGAEHEHIWLRPAGKPSAQPKSLGSALLLKEVRARELWPQYLERLKFNPNHAPAGSPEGGEFTSGEGGGGEPMSSYSALYDYQNYAHGKINRDLREGHTSADHDAYVAAIDAAFSEAPARSATVWRGDGSGLSVVLFEAKPLPGDFKVNLGGIHSLEQAHAVNEQLTAHFRGMVVEDKAYLSTSSSQKIAMDKFVPGNYDISRFGGSGLVEISGKMKSLDIEKITKMGSKEKERLLPRGTKMRIDSVSVQPHPDGERVYLHWKASVVT
jgi:hypothetical protein